MVVFRRMSLAIAAACALTAHGAVAKPDLAQYAKQADAVVKRYEDAGVFSGTVIVAVDGKPVLRKAYGLANREWDIANTIDSAFRLASITKQFTAAAILQLAEKGKLKLDDPISKYYDAPAAWSGITIRHLLTHASGMQDYTQQDGAAPYVADSEVTPEKLVAVVRDMPLKFAPGSKFEYCNTGYVLLGYIIEKVSGQSYGDYLKANIFQPLGMDHSGYDVTGPLVRHRANGYAPGETEVRNTAPIVTEFTASAGGLYSTADDMLRWDQGLHANKILNAESTRQMFTDYGEGNGLGYVVGNENGHRILAHTGKIFGFVSLIAHYPDDKLTIIALSNMMGPTHKLGAELSALYFGVPPARKEIALRPQTLDRYVGTYRNDAGALVTIARRGDRLFGQMKGTGIPAMELSAESETTLFSKIADLQVTFDGKAADKMAGLVVRRSGKDTALTRAAP